MDILSIPKTRIYKATYIFEAPDTAEALFEANEIRGAFMYEVLDASVVRGKMVDGDFVEDYDAEVLEENFLGLPEREEE